MSRKITVETPCRIDLAGGTLDMPPIYLLHYPIVTVNMAINIKAKVTIEPSDMIEVKSVDQNIELKWEEADEITWNKNSSMELILRLIKSFDCNMIDALKGYPAGIKIKINCEAPQGSGLGGSSALAIALTRGLAQYTNTNRLFLNEHELPVVPGGVGVYASRYIINKKNLIEYAKSIETQAIEVPTGYQDYLAAVFGGLRAYSFDLVGDAFCKRFLYGYEVSLSARETFTNKLEKNLLLVYVGKPHFSGANNWELFKKRIDGDPTIIDFFEKLKENGWEMHKAIEEESIEKIGEVMNNDWETRKKMIPNMTSPEIEKLNEIAFRNGAIASRVCGAGEGGCVALLVPPDRRTVLEQKIAEENMRILPVSICHEGMTFKEE